jgi:WD40 repeat protein
MLTTLRSPTIQALNDTRKWSVAKHLGSSTVDKATFVKFLPDEIHCIVVGKQSFSGSHRVHICNVRSKVRVATIGLASGGDAALAVSADGKKLAIKDVAVRQTDAYQASRTQNVFGEGNSAAPAMISIWRINEGKPVFVGQINTGTEFVSAVAMTPDGDTLVTVGQSLRLWNIAEIR